MFPSILTSYQEIEKYKLGHPNTFHYLNQSNCYELVGVSDAHDYLATRNAMDVVGISQKEQVQKQLGSSQYYILSLQVFEISLTLQDAIFRLVATILHLGNIRFSKGEETDSSILEDEKSKFHLQTAAELLMYDWSFYACNANGSQ